MPQKLKALIVAADSVTPDYIFKHRAQFPFFNQIIENGVFAEHAAYVQKGYAESYSSEQNWATIYTGLTPDVHSITTNNVRGQRKRPEMGDFDGLRPFWQVLNDNGYSVGLWAADDCKSPTPINGYAVSVRYDMIETPVENRAAPREVQLCAKDRFLSKFLNGSPPPRLYPQTLKQQGYTFEQLRHDADLAEKAIRKYHFQDALPNFEAELDYWFSAMRCVQRENAVDVLYLFTPTTDVIAHCCMYCDDNPTLIEAYKLLDKYISAFAREFQPENTLFLSDHGQQNFKDLIRCSDVSVQREAFAARDEVLWLKNGYIAFEAYNGALLFTAHALRGIFLAMGKNIRHTRIENARILDIYPTLLELFGCKIPDGRFGYVADIFNRPLVNVEKLMIDGNRKLVAIIQCHAINIMDIVINEVYLADRFADITVVGDAKYMEIIINNPRVTAFVSFERFDISAYDDVYCSYYNAGSGKINHIQISERLK
ncbi:MAG: alkaline phosphatase family protein [Peptococcaceae bacterium]|jgi:arylsulfatase A-like enzyme|nr:alkaline phosphatase family protein [Peptococcaceae bacterium]